MINQNQYAGVFHTFPIIRLSAYLNTSSITSYTVFFLKMISSMLFLLVQEISADLEGNTAKMDKSDKASTVVDLDFLIGFGYGAHLRDLCLL